MADEYIQVNDEIFIPSYHEFENFKSYVTCLEKKKSWLGFVKIHPPKEWLMQWDSVASIGHDMKISPIVQTVEKDADDYLIYTTPHKPVTITVSEYLAKVSTTQNCATANIDNLEHQYWSTLTEGNRIYGADIDYSLGKNLTVWNLNHLDSILKFVRTPQGKFVSGIHTPYLYIGSTNSSFGWHTEDYDLCSINIHLGGAPKVWYFVPREDGLRFDRIVSEKYAYFKCDKFLRHKMCLFGEQFFIQNKIRRIRVIQDVNDIIITFPFIYHSGFNLGVNYNEAVNFGTTSWIEYGKNATHCSCKQSKKKASFQIPLDLETVVKRYQPWKFTDYENRRDLREHPDDPCVRDLKHAAKEQRNNGNFKKFASNVQQRVTEAALNREISSLFLHYLLDQENATFSVKEMRKFRKYAYAKKMKIPHINDATLLTRLQNQVWAKFQSGEDYFNLNSGETSILRDKFKEKD